MTVSIVSVTVSIITVIVITVTVSIVTVRSPVDVYMATTWRGNLDALWATRISILERGEERGEERGAKGRGKRRGRGGVKGR